MSIKHYPQEVWDKIRQEYIYGRTDNKGVHYYPTVREMSERYGIPITAIYHKTFLRKDWQRLRNQKRLDSQLKDSTKERVGFKRAKDLRWESKMEKDLAAAEAIIRHALKKTEEIYTAKNSKVKIQPASIERLIASLERLEKIGRKIYGMEEEKESHLKEEIKKLKSAAKKVILIEPGGKNQEDSNAV